MAPQSLESKVESLEQRVTRLEELPERMDRLESQIVQLRTEMRGEFSAVRGELRDAGVMLREEIRAGDEETRRFMRILHEKVIGDLALLGEARKTQIARRPKKRKS